MKMTPIRVMFRDRVARHGIDGTAAHFQKYAAWYYRQYELARFYGKPVYGMQASEWHKAASQFYAEVRHLMGIE